MEDIDISEMTRDELLQMAVEIIIKMTPEQRKEAAEWLKENTDNGTDNEGAA